MGSIWCVLALSGLAAIPGTSEQPPAFDMAQPIWLEGRALEMNVQAGFRAVVQPEKDAPVLLRIAGCTIYRCFVNGAFVGHGPARGPHGWFRVDEWDCTPFLHEGPNIIAIQAAGYNANSFYVLDQPSFLQAEVLSNGKVLAATGDTAAPFETFALDERVQKVQRYSFQRPFIEYYRLSPNGTPGGTPNK